MSRAYNFVRLIDRTLMKHTREAEMYLTRTKVVYHVPWAWDSETRLKVLRVRKDEEGLWIEMVLPQNPQEVITMFEEEER
jgi:hypothetical protein